MEDIFTPKFIILKFIFTGELGSLTLFGSESSRMPNYKVFKLLMYQIQANITTRELKLAKFIPKKKLGGSISSLEDHK